MKIYRELIATVLIVLGSYALLAAQTDVNATPFSLSLAITTNPVKSGEEIHVKLTTTDTSNQSIVLSKSNPSMEYEFDVRDAQGQSVAKTKFLKDQDDKTTPIVIRRLLKQVLKPGESASEDILISRYYELDKPGDYSIQIRRRVPESLGGGVVKSNTVVVTITL